jgi:hypothetical protein
VNEASILASRRTAKQGVRTLIGDPNMEFIFLPLFHSVGANFRTPPSLFPGTRRAQWKQEGGVSHRVKQPKGSDIARFGLTTQIQ